MPYRILFTDTIDPSSEVENRYPPLGPGYLASYLKNHDPDQSYEFNYVNALTGKRIEDFNPDIIAITAVSQNYERAKKYASLAKDFDKLVVIGGVHISSLPTTLTDQMDIGIIGEGEQTFFEIVQYLSRSGSLDKEKIENIPGICYHKDGRLIIKGKREFLKENEIPHPIRTLTGYRGHDYIFSSRGCPYRCRFCASSRYWDKVRWLAPEFVIEEICDMQDHGTKMISFYDDLFIANKPRLEKIANMIDQKGINKRIKFTCSARANLIDEKTVGYLKKMNVVSVGLGLESGNQRILTYLKGGNISLEDNKRAISLLNRAGIQVNASFIIGSPDETIEEIFDTYHFIQNNGLSFADVYLLTPFPGTPIWDYAKEKGYVSDDMEWSILNINFERNFKSAIILSEKMDRETIIRIYKKFRRLRMYKILIALPKSPWVRDVPKMLVFLIKVHLRRLLP